MGRPVQIRKSPRGWLHTEARGACEPCHRCPRMRADPSQAYAPAWV